MSATADSFVREETFNLGPWKILTRKSHILQSRCTSPTICCNLNRGNDANSCCDFCLYEKELELPQLPEMTFSSNLLRLEHVNGAGIEFNALDSLREVDSKNDILKVAIAEAWQEARAEGLPIKDVIKPFDWTFTTNYKGTVHGKDKLKVSNTEERINIEKLKQKSRILFYEDVILFEDELADNGTTQHSVKIRVMPDSFFLLLRFFLRVDNLLVRIIDTRIFYEEGKNYLLQEHTRKESKIKDLKVGLEFLCNPQSLWDHLPAVNFECEKIEFLL